LVVLVVFLDFTLAIQALSHLSHSTNPILSIFKKAIKVPNIILRVYIYFLI
jgi:hypothetical protein